MKIQRISQYQRQIQFPNFEDHDSAYYQSFIKTDLGKIHCAIPWNELVKVLGLKDSIKGPQSIFSPRGKLALMFLKHYACCSDHKLIEQLNANMDYQLFCDLYIPPQDRLHNFKIVSAIRSEIANRLNISDVQKVLASSWNQYCTNKESITCDATCYESDIRYPTDIKLLWESVYWSHKQLKKISKQVGQRMLRTKYDKWSKRYVQYSKMRQKRKKKARPLIRGLLHLLHKINTRLGEIERLVENNLGPKYWQRRETIGHIYEQQYRKFYHQENPKDRIVSIDKSYIRPIVRGKEIKKVEFGAKVHKLQIDGISYIEHLSFDAFNEGIRLNDTIYLAQSLTNTKVKLLGADGIYANNRNRKALTKQSIQTDFKRKGRASQHEGHRRQLAQMITKERASRLEGSFGTDKEHFLLNRIKARSKLTEILWVFFGIHTSNALKIGSRMAKISAQAA
jgi:hypothetical protein